MGFAKTYIESFAFQRLPTARRAVLALAARVGIADGFRREVVRTDDSGQPVLGPDGRPIVEVVNTLPVSKRFFAGGDTTVRGFALDRLGDAETISRSGFPTGGNGVIILNGEMRVGEIERGIHLERLRQLVDRFVVAALIIQKHSNQRRVRGRCWLELLSVAQALQPCVDVAHVGEIERSDRKSPQHVDPHSPEAESNKGRDYPHRARDIEIA